MAKAVARPVSAFPMDPRLEAAGLSPDSWEKSLI